MNELDKLKLQSELKENLHKRREGTRYFADVIFVREGRRRKKPDKYNARMPYVFLQYLGPVMQWATKNSGLNKREIELILYLYPLGTFTRTEYNLMARAVYLDYGRKLKQLIDNGFIKVWREAKSAKKQPKLYCLSEKGTMLAGKIHKALVGETTIGENPIHSEIAKEKTVKDRYYMSLIKKMNKESKEKKQERESNS